ncbi:MAG TPA: RICIN domain-containing protein [Luteibacter sp.]|jgi:hypothetical protein|nr:RICIN domain-containing protein [Luteibacter sp.]
MAFTPDPNSYYYLVARHSGKVLEIADASKASGAQLQQADASDQHHQQFKFDVAGWRLFTIRARHSGLVIDIHNASEADRANAIQFEWQSHSNQRFRLVDAGDGYYFIEAEHSGKCLDVYGAVKTPGAAVVQHVNFLTGDSHNQQFKPVLVTEDIGLPLLPTFKRPLDIMREVTMGAVGLIPTAGGAIKFITGTLWPDNSLQMVWDQITAYVDKLVETKISRERIIALKTALEGAKINLDEYNALNPGPEKAAFLNSVIATLNMADRNFFRKEEPEKTAAYLMTMGTLKLTLMRERAMNYAAIAKTAEDADSAAHLASLKTAVAEYTKAAQTFRTELLARRLKFLSGVSRSDAIRAGYIGFSVKDARDESEGREATMYSWHVHPPYDRNQLDTANEKMLPACKALVTAQYGAQLDAIFASSRIWSSFIPGSSEAGSKTVYAAVGPFGGGIAATVDLTDKQPITAVRIYNDNFIRGVQAKSESGWGPLVGRAEGKCQELVLKKNERITSAYGQADIYFSSLCFETNFGASIRAFPRYTGTRAWSADLSPELNATLARISASPGEEGVEGITLHWEYAVLGEYPAAKLLRTAKTKDATTVKRTTTST